MEYTVVITKDPNAPWRAVVPAIANCEAEAETREEVLEQIKEAIALMPHRHIEVVKIEMPEAENLYRQNGHLGEAEGNPLLQWAGAFRNDPTWDAMFDEIERQRDATLVRE